MTLAVTVHPEPPTHTFGRDRTVRIGRASGNDVQVGRQLLGGRSSVSKHHVQVAWDGTRWATLNVSDKAGLLRVYEPGFEEVPLEPGRPWVPVRHRWCLVLGGHDHPYRVILTTDDHRGPSTTPAGLDLPTIEPVPDPEVGGDDDPTAALDPVPALTFTELELDALLAYYSGFVLLPRPPVLEPRSHDEAARRLGRTRDSTRKAIERANAKMAEIPGAPAIATGRNVSSEIGRWLARTGLIDLER